MVLREEQPMEKINVFLVSSKKYTFKKLYIFLIEMEKA